MVVWSIARVHVFRVRAKQPISKQFLHATNGTCLTEINKQIERPVVQNQSFDMTSDLSSCLPPFVFYLFVYCSLFDQSPLTRSLCVCARVHIPSDSQAHERQSSKRQSNFFFLSLFPPFFLRTTPLSFSLSSPFTFFPFSRSLVSSFAQRCHLLPSNIVPNHPTHSLTHTFIHP